MSAPVSGAGSASGEAERRVKEQAVRLLQRMQARLDVAEARLSAPVAVIGMGCRLPLGDTPDAVWTALADGRDGIRTVPPGRWLAGAGAVAYGGFLDGVDRFDAAFFGISPREAAAMDPQQRIALEVAWEALEDAAIPADRLEGTRAGVYLGCCTADYARLGDADVASADGYAATGGAPGVTAGRIAYSLGLNGPALVVDTACSSSLVALHLAVQGLRAGECSLALAGGVNLTLLPQGAATLDRLHMLSPDGRCKAFDARADGFVRGEGCGVVVLKLLSEAQAAGDQVLAVIRGSAVNQDGRSAGLTAPNGPSQEAVIRAALSNAGLAAHAVDYVEAHGTGTALGDPIEMHALAGVFAPRDRPLLVGSVKTNMGHAEAAAGIAGLIKAVLMLQRQAVPASLHFERLNPHIEVRGAPIAVPTVLASQELRVVGVSSFGFSGTNAHVVLERAPGVVLERAPGVVLERAPGVVPERGSGTVSEPASGPDHASNVAPERAAMPQRAALPAREPPPGGPPSHQLLISARTRDALRTLIARYRERLAAGVPFADLCHSAATTRARLPWWVCVASPDALATAQPSDAPPPELPPQPGRRVPLPLYPFQRERYWLDEAERMPGRRLVQAGDAPLFEVELLPDAPLVADHRVRGQPLLPAADMVERLRAAAQAEGRGDALRDIKLDRALPVLSPRRIQVAAGDPLGLFAQHEQGWHRHASARPAAAEALEAVDLVTLRGLCAEPIRPAAFASWLADTGLAYGPFYDCIEALWRGPSQALARLRPAHYVALLDAAFRTAGGISFGAGGAARLPAGIARYARALDARALGAMGEEVWAHAALIEEGPGLSVVDVRLIDASGATLARIEGLRLAAVGAGEDAWRSWLHVVEWVPSPTPAAVREEALAGLGDTAALEHALDNAAAFFASEALSQVPEAAVAPRHLRLYRHLTRLAARPASAMVPDGPEGALLARCGAALAGVLRGEVDPLPLLFAEGAAGGIYRDAPVYRAANTVIASLAAAALPPTGPVRVLEIGAGTGGTTEAVLAALERRRLEYWFTDISPTLVAQARSRIAAQHFATFDVERPTSEQGVPPGGFDLVLAANVLHATADLGAALDHALEALAPGGRLLLLETAPPGDPPAGWIDLVFGLTEGWWRFSDTALRPDYPLLSGDAWARLLEQRGLEAELCSLPGHTVILARHRLATKVHRDAGGPAHARCAALLGAIQGLRDEARFVLVTQGAMGPHVSDPAGAALWGMMRSLRQERPELDVRCIDLGDSGNGPSVDLDPHARSLLLQSVEPELVLAHGRTLVPRLGTPVASSGTMLESPAPRVPSSGTPIPSSRAPGTSSGTPIASSGAPGPSPGTPIASSGAPDVSSGTPGPSSGTAAPRRGSSGPPIDPEGWVLVTGAFGGLGRFTAEWLVSNGARRLVLGTRSAAEPEWVGDLRGAGVSVRVERGDLADPQARAALIRALPPLSGIVHAAGILDDATLAQARPAQFAAVLAPKFEAAVALDQAFPSLDFFVLFSSAVGLFGQAGQATHVAVSLALDALAATRRARGQHAVSLGWGLWRDIGSAAGRTELIGRMASQGMAAIPTEAGAAVLGWALQARDAAVTVLPVDRPRFLAGFETGRAPAAARSWFTERSRPPAPAAKPGAMPARDDALPAKDMAAIIVQEAASVLGYPPGRAIDPAANLFELGLDSLMAVELRNRLQSRLPGRTLSSTLLFEHATIAALTAHLAGEERAPTPIAPAPAQADAPIAIVGMGCRFPAGGSDPAAFWQALAEGRDGVIPRPERPDATVREGAAQRAGYLPDVAGFDPTFFGIAPREAVFMDPQHRLVLEVAWEALEDALIPPDRLAGMPAGVFLGMCNYDYAQFAAAAEGADGYAGTGGAPSIAAGRLAYLLGLTGPAMVVDTACSSSLVTVHLAVQALRRGECSLALAGGVNLTLGTGTTTALERLSMLSPNGHCRAFDARADGFVRGEGCGVVVLKRLSEAAAAGDRVLAVIRGTAVNQDGRSAGLTAPNGSSQAAVIRAALSSGGVDPASVDYVEAHGTGTALGDPIEMHALAGVFGGRDRALLVGSVKTNIGHAEAAAGIAGLIKAALMLRHQAIPASLHFERLNPHIELGDAPIAVPTSLTRRELGFAGVSSFGFSGTNAHVVLERGEVVCAAAEVRPPANAPAPASPAAAAPADALPAAASPVAAAPAAAWPAAAPRQFGDGANPAAPQLLIFARTPEALRTLVARYQALLAAEVPFADLCHSAAIGRSAMRWWVCVDRSEALATAEPSDAPPPQLPPQAGRRVDLPLYPFQRQAYWAHPKRTRPATPRGSHPLRGRRIRSSLAQRQYETVLAADEPAWLADHAVGGRVIVPAAALVEMMLSAIPDAGPVTLTGIAFRAMLAPAEQPLVQIVADPAARTLTIAAAPDADDAPFQTVASASWEPAGRIPEWDLEAAALPTASRIVDLPSLYDRFAAAGLGYGPAFRGLRLLRGGPGVALAELPDPDPAFRLDPLVLDAAWQSLAAALPPDSAAGLVPVGVERLVWRGGTPRRSILRLTAPDRADIVLLDEAGDMVAWCEGLRLAAVAASRAQVVIQETAWDPVPLGDDIPDWVDCREDADPVTACWRVLEAYRAAGDLPARLGVLARGATDARGTIPAPAQAALVGLVATLGRERPELRPVLLDLDDVAAPPPVPAACGPLLAWRDGELLAPRPQARDTAPQPEAPFVLARGEAATLDALRWAPASRRSPARGEVEIEIAAAGINFRDVMNLLGVYPGDGGAPGVECAGTVTAVGEGVASVSPGDPVVAIAPGCFASHVIADEKLVCRAPASLDWRDLAGQPVAMLTARLALDEAAVRPGQRVLVHAATGGVGLAAVGLARQRGAQVVATAGSAAKRAYLAALGVREVYDSRSLDFAAARPVDVVLNSLTGPAIPAGLQLLKPGGLFLELGKAELWTEAQVEAVRPDVRYVAVALDQVILDEPDRVGAMLRQAVDALTGKGAALTGAGAALTGNGAALPVEPYAFSAITDALRCLQAARHIGKLVLARTMFRGDAAYVITGGTGALGGHLARWLTARGARHLVLLARRPDLVEVPGASVRTIAVDVTDEAAVRQALSDLPVPVKGVFHLAASLHDATAERLTREQVAAAFSAKLGGAEVLDRATADMPLDLFVLFGSLAAVVGSAGQANYAAANAALDAVVRRRRGPALLVDWGAWQGEGMAQGLAGPALPPEAALAAMDAALSAGLRRVSVSAATASAAAAVTPLAERLAGAIGAGKLDVLADAVDAIVGRILGLGELSLDRARPLSELGLDSLMAVELRNALGAAIGRTLPTSLVFDHPTAEALTGFLGQELGLADRRSEAAQAVLVSASVRAAMPLAGTRTVDEMDDEAALLLLERKLSHAGY